MNRIDFVTNSSNYPGRTSDQTQIWAALNTVYGVSSYKTATSPTTTMSYNFAAGNYSAIAVGIQQVPNTASNVLAPVLTLTKTGIDGLNLTNSSFQYFGDSLTDGSWRFGLSGNDLVFERRESGSWTEKGKFTA